MLSLILLFIASSKAQLCTPDLLIDDVSAIRQKWIGGANRFINMAGGDYGVDPQSEFAVQVNNKSVMFDPKNSANSYFFIKFVSLRPLCSMTIDLHICTV
jgi:hypothetical protein